MRRHHYEQELKATYNREAHLASRLADADETLSILLELEPQLSKYRIERSEWQGGGCFWDLEGIRAAKKFRDDQANAEKYLPGSKFGDEKEIAELLGETGVSDPQARETVREFAEPDFDPIPRRTRQTIELSPTDRQLLRDIGKVKIGPVALARIAETLSATYGIAENGISQATRIARPYTAAPGLYRLGNGMVVEKRPGGWFSPNGSKQMDREVSFSATLTRLEVAK